MVKEKQLAENDQLLDKQANKKLIVHNDDVNTFDHVIQTLIDVCKHEREQAEQCTLIIHYKGKCDVKSGNVDYLEPMCKEIINRGILASID